jgi:plastocyanin
MARTDSFRAALVVLVLALVAAGCGGEPAPETAAETPAAETAAPAAPSAPEAAPAGTASITGFVHYEGEVPKLRPVTMTADPACAGKHGQPVANEALVLGEGNALVNAFVEVTAGLPDQGWPVPSSPVLLDQQGCRYVPHVVGVMAGQTMKILNSDGLMHNVHALPKTNKEFNRAMPPNMTETEHVFPQAENAFKVKCDVHPWMGA